jgi:hypothetical protein
VKKENNKICPERAVQMMNVKGTSSGGITFPNIPFMKAKADGFRTFKFIDVLDEYINLKSYSAKSSQYFQELIQGKVKLIQAAVYYRHSSTTYSSDSTKGYQQQLHQC